MDKGGIAIRDFERLSTDKSFVGACNTFKARLNGEDEARSFAGLSNLNEYRRSDKHGEFIRKVDVALAFIANRRMNKALRKVGQAKGVKLVYEDASCFIVKPDGPASSYHAAHLDNAAANWCVAIKNAEKAAHYWEGYGANCVFFIYMKDGSESWAMLLSNYDAFRLKHPHFLSHPSFPTSIESRENKGLSERIAERLVKNYKSMLSMTGLTDGTLKTIALKNMSPLDPGTPAFVWRALKRESDESFPEVVKQTDFDKFDKMATTSFIELAIALESVKKLDYLIGKRGLEYATLHGTEGEFSGNQLLFEALDDPDCLKYLLDLGLDPNARCEHVGPVSVRPPRNAEVAADSLLFCALNRLRLKAACILLKRGVDCGDDMARFSRERCISFDDEGLAELNTLIAYGYSPDWNAFIEKTAKLFPSHRIVGVLSLLLRRGVRYNAEERAMEPIVTQENRGSGDFAETANLLLKLGIPRERLFS